MLRDELGLIGTKEGCGEGECGSCTVIMDGQAVSSCLVLAPQINGKEIITVEGLAGDRELDLLQQKFIEHSAVECRFLYSRYVDVSQSPLDEEPSSYR